MENRTGRRMRIVWGTASSSGGAEMEGEKTTSYVLLHSVVVSLVTFTQREPMWFLPSACTNTTNECAPMGHT